MEFAFTFCCCSFPSLYFTPMPTLPMNMYTRTYIHVSARKSTHAHTHTHVCMCAYEALVGASSCNLQDLHRIGKCFQPRKSEAFFGLLACGSLERGGAELATVLNQVLLWFWKRLQLLLSRLNPSSACQALRWLSFCWKLQVPCSEVCSHPRNPK